MRRARAYEPDVDKFSELLREAVGDSTVAIHWDYAREVLARADGVLATVGLAADAPRRRTRGTRHGAWRDAGYGAAAPACGRAGRGPLLEGHLFAVFGVGVE